MFLGINMFLALLKLILALTALGLKWVWVGPKTYLYPRTSTLLLYFTPVSSDLMGFRKNAILDCKTVQLTCHTVPMAFIPMGILSVGTITKQKD